MRVTIDGQCGNLWAQISLTVDRLQNSARAPRNYDVTDKYLSAASILFHPFIVHFLSPPDLRAKWSKEMHNSRLRLCKGTVAKVERVHRIVRLLPSG